jgi:hypothetical protein
MKKLIQYKHNTGDIVLGQYQITIGVNSLKEIEEIDRLLPDIQPLTGSCIKDGFLSLRNIQLSDEEVSELQAYSRERKKVSHRLMTFLRGIKYQIRLLLTGYPRSLQNDGSKTLLFSASRPSKQTFEFGE